MTLLLYRLFANVNFAFITRTYDVIVTLPPNISIWDQQLVNLTLSLHVLILTFSGKLVIFQKIFFGKLSYFSVFRNDLENEIESIF